MNKTLQITEARFIEYVDNEYWLTINDAHSSIGIAHILAVSIRLDYEFLRCIALRTVIPKELPVNLEVFNPSWEICGYLEVPMTTMVKRKDTTSLITIYVSIHFGTLVNFYTPSFSANFVAEDMVKVVEFLRPPVNYVYLT